ncbi:MAG: tRNA (N(6)-L-threonylcarbamoyladenosine(37)-C(2))-methylthiotransferase MtaB [Halobacteriovoraceae bacterium]|nr:tRNA (N(6)-L-threonylcarbamoyladenosine(37)-C(2))-methylthiotransferase MtaB [Halobacteriovoraceae bacterium]
MDKTVSFHTLGCRLNFSETGSIADGFLKRGYRIVEFGKPSDVTFLNTCTVTDGADSSCRNLIRKAHKLSPGGKIVVAGCYAQMESEKIQKMQGVDLILGNSEKYRVFDYLDEDDDNMIKIDQTNEFWGAYTTPGDMGHTRAFLKIQDGCNYVCSFCIIPFARGRSRTISVANATKNARELVNIGYKEIVLTGVNIGEYESQSGERLETLIEELAKIEGLKRLRLSSVEPNTITKSLLKTLKATKIYQDHFHIPLQSGDDGILKSMRRKYTVEQYRQTIELIKNEFPNCGIGADVIVGYPGETEEQFQNTYKLLDELPITHFHVFPFSKRKGTTAAKLDDQITQAEKKRRVSLLNELGDKKLEKFARSFVGSNQNVLFEQKKENYWIGQTPQFLKIKVRDDKLQKNQIAQIKILESQNSALLGAIHL